ncbi:NAD(P)/FAD-dependent oxidoreductase [Solicola gregarius]|uniref:FAD-binding oxidoreductase n=1 Tax=Solicola gregarius TaxID=2908642 RepID=A0AA46TFX6_9ACTN|nr:FAD-dependent oxidoreductase [Solicola gregarius]UYM04443.1 FAD-binding oxidoreductase [Solicola gregarius]
MSDLAERVRRAKPEPFWLDDDASPEPLPPLAHDVSTDLLVVGGGYSGLWSALLAKERHPDRAVMLVEAGTCGGEASGRNGGFCEASLTHGFDNGLSRWPDDLPALLRMGRENLDEIEAAVSRYGIDCNFERNGELDVATDEYQVDELRDAAAAMSAYGLPATFVERDDARARFDSPAVLAALHDPDVALVEPARLAWGLRSACLEAGVEIFESSHASAIDRDDAGVRVRVGDRTVQARRVILATNAFPPLLRRLRLMTVPVYDYALVTDPLSDLQRKEIGWAGREGVGDSGNQFHYLRLTRDNRILFGGYDAIYHYGNGIRRSYEQRQATFETLGRHFEEYFPALQGIGFSHRWGGVIDTSTQFCAFYGTAYDGAVAYALGFTGLGVGATRFAALVMLDLLDGAKTERTELEMVRRKPLPFPPEPARYAGVQLTRWSLAKADANQGKRNAWLKLTDALGLGFDS